MVSPSPGREVRDSNERHDAVAEFGLGTNTLVSDRYAGRVGVPYRVTLCALPDAENVANAGRILDGELGGLRVSHGVGEKPRARHLESAATISAANASATTAQQNLAFIGLPPSPRTRGRHDGAR
jgi:hypothetical protein